MSTLYVDNLEPNLGSQVEIPDLKPLAGSVLQIQQSVLTTTWRAVAAELLGILPH